MINLLSLKEKSELLLKNKTKLVIILGLVFVTFLVCLSLILNSIKFYIMKECADQSFFVKDSEIKYNSGNLSEIKSTIEKYNAILSSVNSFYKGEIFFTDILRSISKMKIPKGVYFTNINLVEKNKKDQVIVSISGISDSRENLFSLKENIKSDKWIIDPYFPPESWITPENISFSLQFKVRYENKE